MPLKFAWLGKIALLLSLWMIGSPGWTNAADRGPNTVRPISSSELAWNSPCPNTLPSVQLGLPEGDQVGLFWELRLAYTYTIDAQESLTPTLRLITQSGEQVPTSIRKIGRKNTDFSYEVYVDVQHDDLFEPTNNDQADRLASAINDLWKNLSLIEDDATLPQSTTLPKISCNCSCIEKGQPIIKPGTPISNESLRNDPGVALSKLFTCIREDFETHNTPEWRPGFSDPDWRIVVIGQVDILDMISESKTTSASSAITERYAEHIKFDDTSKTRAVFVLFDPRKPAGSPVPNQDDFKNVAKEVQIQMTEPRGGTRIYISDYRDENLRSLLAPPTEVNISASVGKLLSTESLESSKIELELPGCASIITVSGDKIDRHYDKPTASDLNSFWPIYAMHLLGWILFVGTCGLLFCIVAYRNDWFGIRRSLELEFRFPWYDDYNE